MKRLPVRIVSPKSTEIIGKLPPELRFYLNQRGIDKSSLRCFVSGQADCLISQVEGEEGLYEAKATQTLIGRRSKYTLTASGLNGRSWYWFSQLWVRSRGSEVADVPVPR